MLTVDPVVVEALRTHQEGRSAATLYYQGRVSDSRVLRPSGSLTARSTGEVQTSGSLEFVGAGPVSLVPRSRTDPLAPYGQEVVLRRELLIGGSWWEIPLGRFGVTKVTDSAETFRGGFVESWRVSVDVDDRFEPIRADDFLAVDSPSGGPTVWSEVRRLSPWPVQESITDLFLPRGLVYENRLKAIGDLLDLIGGVPHMTREGVLTARLADGWLTKTVAEFEIPGVISWREGMSKDFYNQVVVSSSSNNELVEFAQITDPSNPLSVGRVGGRTYKHSSPLYETQGAVRESAETILARVSTKRSRQVDVVTGPEGLLLDLGDFGWFADPRQGRKVLGEVTGLTIPLDPLEGVGVEVTVAEES